jgi:hypothetical protein
MCLKNICTTIYVLKVPRCILDPEASYPINDSGSGHCSALTDLTGYATGELYRASMF